MRFISRPLYILCIIFWALASHDGNALSNSIALLGEIVTEQILHVTHSNTSRRIVFVIIPMSNDASSFSHTGDSAYLDASV